MMTYNDNELLYLIDEHDEDAFMVLYHKYVPLIKSRLKKYNIHDSTYEDFFQECVIMFVRAIDTYHRDRRKTFNKYFDLLVSRRIVDVLKKENYYRYNVAFGYDNDNVIYEKTQIDYDQDGPLDLDNIAYLSDLEKKVYKLCIEDGAKPGVVAKHLGLETRKIYNAILRIKRKIKERHHDSL